ncbi:hypothetical protein GCM10009527_096360 [Actinomadura nitritigenes]|uniref:Uncharacterized protein n=1 Tax=Actinomadura nitritigenes TaxID=134602 RepID=A0ABS3RHS1_9ACTN|nr:hypothetical protein [Actinomadura nitritigenes]MBO2445432.1 hypothetical protein [Actinomadura nitritigenes]
MGVDGNPIRLRFWSGRQQIDQNTAHCAAINLSSDTQMFLTAATAERRRCERELAVVCGQIIEEAQVSGLPGRAVGS